MTILLPLPSASRFPGIRAVRWASLAWILVAGLVSGARGAPAAAPLTAGVARMDLTPPLAMKAALGGYGARMNRPAVGVHDAVWVKALVLAQDDRRFAVVTADVLAFPPGFKTAVLKRLAGDGWEADRVLLLASHSHTSLDMMALHPGNTFGIPQVGVFHREAFELAVDRVVSAVREAAREPRPVAVGSAVETIAGRNRNRRDGGGAHDPDLTVTRVDVVGGRPLAALVNWTAHPTFMDEEDMLFSGDWPGHLQRTLEALIGDGVVVLFYNGAEGDQSPVPPAECTSHWERAERYGRDLGIRAWRTWERTVPGPRAVFEFRSIVFALPGRTWHPDFMKTGGAEYGLSEALMPKFLEALQPVETRTTSLRLGDLLILGVPGEMSAELGLQLKARARTATGVPAVTIGGLADEWVSYILTAEEYRRGGYEASVSFYGETLGATVVDAVMRGALAAGGAAGRLP